MLEAVPDRPDLVVRLLVDDDSFTIVSAADGVDVHYGETSTEPDLVVRTDYQGFLDAGEGRMSLDEFAGHHLDVVEGADHAETFLMLMATAMIQAA